MPQPFLLSSPALRGPHGPPPADHEQVRPRRFGGAPVPPRQHADAEWAPLVLALQRRVLLLLLVCSLVADPPLRAHESALDVDQALRWRQWLLSLRLPDRRRRLACGRGVERHVAPLRGTPRIRKSRTSS